MTLPLNGEVTLEAGGVTYRLKFGARASMALEAHFPALDQQEIGALIDAPRVTEQREFLRAMLLKHHGDVADAVIDEIFDAAGNGKVFTKIQAAFLAAYGLTEAEVEELKRNPQKVLAGMLAGTGVASTGSGSSTASRQRTSGTKRRG